MFGPMLASIILALSAMLPQVSAAALPMDMRGLNRLRNSTLSRRASGIFPSGTIHGVNIGAWFVFEPYMAISEWQSMGGDGLCNDCTNCVNDEFQLTQRLGQTQANTVFMNHWKTFITQDDVNLMVQYGINSVRIPLGFWIIEEQVNSNEFYPQGGLSVLRQACRMFNDAGISVLLDLHAAPGAQVAGNAFTGHCVSTPGFWNNQNNFDRMVAAGVGLARAVHSDPEDFGSVWGIEALNEPPQNGADTPNYFSFLQEFVNAVRSLESSMGVPASSALSMTFMDYEWQFENPTESGAFTENGGNAYDSHLYYSFGAPCGQNGCVQANLNSHIQFACQGGGGRISQDKTQFNTPTFLGEWWLEPLPGTFGFFDQASARAFGDAQKRGYSPEGGNGGSGWYFWSWKMTNSDSDGSNHMRSYKDAVAQGYLPSPASSYFNSGVCG